MSRDREAVAELCAGGPRQVDAQGVSFKGEVISQIPAGVQRQAPDSIACFADFITVPGEIGTNGVDKTHTQRISSIYIDE